MYKYDPAIFQASLPVYEVTNMPSSAPTEASNFFSLKIYKIEPVAGSIHIDPLKGNRQYVLMTADLDVYFDDPGVDCTVMVTFIQDDTGGRVATFHSNNGTNDYPEYPLVKWIGGGFSAMSLSTPAKAEDVLSLEWNKDLNRYLAMYTLDCEAL